MAQQKAYILSGLLIFILAGTAATRPQDGDDHYTNLKVLPKKISEDDMERAMYVFEKQLGVTCVYCHVPTKNEVPKRMDFASDEKPEKKIAREMLRMSIKMNKKYFGMSTIAEILNKPKVWCRTCHYGFPRPPGLK